MSRAPKRNRVITITDRDGDGDSDSELNDDNDVQDDFDAAKREMANFEELRKSCVGDTNLCWMCKYKFRPDNVHSRDPCLRRMIQEYNANVGTIPPEELAVVLMGIFDVDYRKKELEMGNTEAMIMTLDMMVRHLRFHMFTYKQTLDDTIQDMILIENELKNSVFAVVGGKDGRSSKIPIDKTMNVYIKLVQQKTATVVAAAKALKKG